MNNYVKVKDLPVGVGTDLILHIDGVEARLRSSIVGIKTPEYLIIDSPRMTGIESKLYEGNKTKVIFMYSGVIYGFQSLILNRISNPSRLIFVSYPDNIERQELREYHRVECYIPGIGKLPEEDLEFSGVVLDISPQGCRFSSLDIPNKKRPLFQPKKKINLYFELLGVEGTRTFGAEIQSVHEDGRKISIGIKFEDVSQSILNKLEEYVKSVTEYLL